ncbi:cyanophycin synthetase [Rhodoferax antarcticus]|uniref:Cyanophycin synthetase n=1 Tax=Rhodoferax antarcticus ANT.BR TaxID=1111071 RepID=A0A1Q8YC09_9BURK|nr:cyanophycin synthetase [Rhodoferax antarcticus]APW46683.1 cyanophycin synthetase [Rhodoferax antarcticus]OLP05586.1 cyanophycin synthetase [Rhodoferax antarcticus ANT.BR]
MTIKTIELLRVAHLRGPNIWTYRPVIEAWLDIGDLEDYPSNTLPGFYERLTAMLPGLAVHRCGVGMPGGFLERLREGTWAGHILEHVVLELQNMAGMRTGFGKTRQTSVRGVYKMAFRTRQEEVGRAALIEGLDLLHAAIHDTGFDVTAAQARLRELVDRYCLGPSTAHIVEAATERGIAHIRLTDGNLVQLGHGARQRRIWTAETDHTSAIAEEIAGDKDLTKSLLRCAGVPVPEGQVVQTADQAWEAAQEIGLPVVVKPYNGNHGRGVSLDLGTRKDIDAAFALAKRKGGDDVIVEQYIPGNEHRLLVVGTQVVAAARGDIAWVTGDGHSDIIALVDSQINADPRRGVTEDAPLNALSPQEGAEIILELERQGLTAYTVPAAGRTVLIQRNGNVAFDVTDQIHPSVAAMAALAARVVGLDIAGVDMVLEDAARPMDQQRGAVVEVNASPGLLAHLKPASGSARPIGRAIMAHMFEPGDTGRIKLVGITGQKDTALLARLVSWMLCIQSQKVGLACRDGFYLGARRVNAQDCSGWDAGQNLLMNRSLEVAVFEHTPQGILNDGLAYDKCTVGVVTDLGDYDALSDFYIDHPDKLYSVMRTQVDVILPHGTAVLNAADPQVAEMAPLCDGQVIFYALSPDIEVLAAHQTAGGQVVFLQDGHLLLAQGQATVARLPLNSLPAWPDDKLQVLLAAAATTWALGMPPELIGAGLCTFQIPLQNAVVS